MLIDPFMTGDKAGYVENCMKKK